MAASARRAPQGGRVSRWRRIWVDRPERDEAWLSHRLGVWLDMRGPLVDVDDWAMLVDWLAGQLGCDVDLDIIGPASVAITLGPDCPTDERGAAVYALVRHTPPGVWCHVAYIERAAMEAA